MSPALKKEIDTIVAEHNYSSTSEFFRDAIRAWKEHQLYLSVMRSEKDVKSGRVKRLRSVKDLM